MILIWNRFHFNFSFEIIKTEYSNRGHAIIELVKVGLPNGLLIILFILFALWLNRATVTSGSVECGETPICSNNISLQSQFSKINKKWVTERAPF